MPWYRTGTVAITANTSTVTGTGTNFSQNSRVGDAFQGPDGRWYEVTNISSATVLSIAPNYQGTTATAGVYALAPMQGYVKQSADQLRTITNQYGTVLGLLGTPTDAAGLRTNIGAAKSGVNSDITQLTGLTTPLGTTMGGTGGNTPAAARAALGIGEAGRLAYSTGFTITDTTRPFDDQQAVRVADAVFASRARSGFYATTTSGVNIDTVPAGWCGLITSTGSNNTGTFPSFATSGFFYLMTQGTYVNSAATQIAFRYGANSTSGTNLNPTMAIRTRNAPGTAWGPWGIVQTDQDLTASRNDSTIGKILKVEDFGIGAKTGGLFLADIDDATLGNGWYAIGAGTTTGTKPGGQTYGILQVSGRNNNTTTGRVQQIFYSTDSTIPRTWNRSFFGTAWSDWTQSISSSDVVTSTTDTTVGKLVSVGHMGWGSASSPRITDFNTQSAGGFYSTNTNASNAPSTSAYVGATLAFNSTAYGQIAMATSSSVTNNKMYFRNTSSGTPTAWKEVTTRNDIVGTVSGTSAAPTGSIIERGGNANGDYIKFADGTMICFRNMSDTIAIDTSLLGGFRSANITWTYPVPFVTSPIVQSCARASAFGMYSAPSAAVSGSFTEAIYNYVSITSSASFARYGSLVAIGRWAA